MASREIVGMKAIWAARGLSTGASKSAKATKTSVSIPADRTYTYDAHCKGNRRSESQMVERFKLQLQFFLKTSILDEVECNFKFICYKEFYIV